MKPSTRNSFVMAIALYSALLAMGYHFFSSSIQEDSLKIFDSAEVPVSLSMFQSPSPSPTIAPQTPKSQTKSNAPKPTEAPKKKAAPQTVPKETKPKIVKPKTAKPKVIKPRAIKPTPIKPKPHTKKTPVESPNVLSVVDTTVKSIDLTEPTQTVSLDNSPSIKTPPKTAFSQQAIATAESAYLQALRSQIARHAADTYPRLAKRRRWEGTVLIEFTLLKNGKITQLNIVNSSGHLALDQAASRIIQAKMNNHFKAFPKEIDRQQWRMTIPIGYHLTYH